MKSFTKKIALTLSIGLTIGFTSQAQITKVNDFKNFTSPAIGTFQGINFREAGFSGLFAIEGTNGKEFWTVSDRGVNIDAANANPSTCRPTYDKIYAFQNYAPKIHRIKVEGDSIVILQTITMKRPSGSTATGLLNPTGFGSTALEAGSTDTVLNCANFNNKLSPKDVWGIDAEGIAVDRKGFFWICEEGGPTIWKLNPNGVVVSRFTPYKNLVGSENIDVQIDTVFKYRKNNRGFEGICIAPNGKVYAMIQSPLLYPSKSVGEASRIHRVLEINPENNSSKAYAYLNDGIIGASGSNQIRLRDWKIGDMAAVNDSVFLVIEQALRGTTDRKNIYTININGATPVTGALYSGLTLEGLVDSAGLANNNIKPVKKKLFMNLLANGWDPILEKAEGLAIINDSTIAICNDNDFGQVSAAENGVATATTILSHLVVYNLKGANKLQNFKTYKATNNVVLSNHSVTPSLLFTNKDVPNIEMYRLISSDDVLAQSPSFVFGGSADGTGLVKNSDGTFTLLTNHEDNFSVSRITLDNTFKPVRGEYLMNSNAGIWRLCSGTMAKPEEHGFGPYFLTCGESGEESMTHAISPYANPVTDTLITEANSFTLAKGLGRWSAENAVPLHKDAYPSKTVIIIGDDDSGPAGGQLAMYTSNTGDLQNGNLYILKLKSGNYKETSMKVNGVSHAYEFVQVPNHRSLTGAQINTFAQNMNAVRFGRVEDVDYRKGSGDASREVYFTVTGQDFTGVNADTSRTKYGRVYRLKMDKNNMMTGTIECVLDGDDKSTTNAARTFYDVDNICVTNDYVYVQEDPNGYAPSGNPSRHDSRIYMYDIETKELLTVTELDHRRKGSAYPDSALYNQNSSGTGYASSSLGSWEYGALIDISNEVNIPNTFLLSIQPHTWRGAKYKGVDGGTVRKSEFQASALVVLKNLPRAKVKLPFAKDVSVCKGDSAVLTATGGYNNATYKWYATSSGGSPIFVGNNFKVGSEFSRTYYVSASALGTESSRFSVNLTVVNKPSINLGSDIVACEKVVIEAMQVSGNVIWSDNSTANTLEVTKSGTYWAKTVNQNGCESYDTVQVTINALPNTPVITLNGSLLTSSNLNGNQWYLDSVAIPNATSQTYTATVSGAYTVKTTDATTGCVSKRSSSVGMMLLGIDETVASNDFKVYPNPNDGKFNLKFNIDKKSNVKIRVTNVLGQIVYENMLFNFDGLHAEEIDLSSFSKGQYVVNVFSDYINMQKIITKL